MMGETPFADVLTALRWYLAAGRRACSPFVRAYRLHERISQSRLSSLDERIAEPAVLYMRVESLLDELDKTVRARLLGNDWRLLGFSNRNAMYKYQHKMRRQLEPAFIAAGLIPPDRGEEGSR